MILEYHQNYLANMRKLQHSRVRKLEYHTNFLKVLKNPEHEEYEDLLNWVGGKFDPEYFDPQKVRFMDPVKRRKSAFGE